MLNEAVKNQIDEMLRSKINEAIVRNKVRDIVKEEVYRYTNGLISEANDVDMKRKAVMNMLKDDKFNHAELMRHIYHPRDKGEEDTYRSLFSKKATGKPDADGSVRHFTDQEITKLYELLREK